jgi:hypothetical protein
MEMAEQTRLETAQREARSHDMTILLRYSILAIALLIGIFAVYWDSMYAGTSVGDLAMMTVFP